MQVTQRRAKEASLETENSWNTRDSGLCAIPEGMSPKKMSHEVLWAALAAADGVLGCTTPHLGCLLCRVSRAPRPLSLQVRTAADDVLANVQRGNYTVLHKLFSEFQSDAAFFTVLNCFVL